MQRHGHRIKSKRGVWFDKNRDDWCSYLNFEEMYDEIYDLLVEKGITAKLDQETWFNNSGNIVEYEEEAVRCKTQYTLIHPEKFLFVDEVGSNTS